MTAPPDDRHDAVQLLLPWYAAGTLEDADREAVERHLTGCAACRSDLAAEAALAGAVAALPVPAEDGWPALMERITAHPTLPPAAEPRRTVRRAWGRPGRLLGDPRRLRWLVGAQFAAIVALAVAVALPGERPGPYRALGDGSGAHGGNVLAMFRPDTPEAAMRRALTGAGARVVDGPTSAGAYVLDVPGGDKGAALAALRADPGVTMAEPIGPTPAE